MKRFGIAAVSCFAFCCQASGQNGIIATIAGGVPYTFPTSVTLALNAPLGYVSAVATDSQGNTYVADTSNDRVFRVSPAGGIQIVAGNGNYGFSGDGGPATSASLSGPTAIAADPSGNIFIADHNNNRIRKVSASGIITTVAGNGNYAFSGDGGPATSASLNYPSGVAVDASGNIFIEDDDRIRKVSVSGIITTIAGNGNYGFSGDGGTATSASLNNPAGVAVDASGNLYIADQQNGRIRKVSAAGIITTVAGNGSYAFSGDNGPATSASLRYPSAIAVDASGNLFIADLYSYRIRKVSTAGTITTVAGITTSGFSGDGGSATSAALSGPVGVAGDTSGNIFIADSNNDRVRKVSASGTITTFAGNGGYGASGDGGPATSATLNSPSGVAMDGSSNLFIADTYNNRIRKVSASGIITTVAGNGTSGFSGDGGPATSASLNDPVGVSVDASGNLYIADRGNNRIRKISSTGTITTVAGNGNSGFAGDGGPATSASLSFLLAGVAVDPSGELFISDQGNNRIRKVSATGIITTVAGNATPAFSGDGGPATSASLNNPQGIALDASGNLFIADDGNSRIRKVSATGNITTVAGSGTFGFSGDDGPANLAWLDNPQSVAVDASGNLFIADSGNNRIRVVSTTGIITTEAGNGIGAFSGDGGPATLASLSDPSGVAVDPSGNIFIADQGNNRIRRASTPSPSLTAYPAILTLTLAAGGSSTQQISLGSTPGVTWSATASTTWVTLSPASGVSSGTITATVKTASLQPGPYTATITISNPSATPAQETVTVSLTVDSTPTLSVIPSSLSLQSQKGGPAQSQSIQIGGTAGTAWQASATTSTGGAWLSVSTASGQIPATLTALVNLGSLALGTYQGSITVQAPGATPSSSTVNITLTVTAAGAQPIDPQVISANNSADYSTTLAQGSLFVVFGSSLGPVTLASISALPLPNVLAGTSVTVTAGSATLNCPMIYTSAGQVAAILPSNTPVGEAIITVAYDGITDPNQQSTTRVTVVPSSVGIFTLTSSGLGTGVFTALDNTVITLTNSAQPGQIVYVWGTGLGPISTPDNVLPASYPNFPNVQVFVGGQSAQIVYAGRSGCCAAIDQIAFTVPAAVSLGCNVPVTIVSGGVSSNTVGMPLSASPGPCGDSGPTLPSSFLTKAAAGQPIDIAAIAIGPAVFGNNAGEAAAQAVAARLSAALHTRVPEADAARLMRAYASNKPKAMRGAMAKYARQWKALDAKTKATMASQLAQSPGAAIAEFENYTSEGYAASLASAQLPTAGSCVIVPVNSFSSGLGGVANSGLDAGASLLLTGAAGSLTLNRGVSGQYNAMFGSSVTGLTVPLGSYTISGSGGKDVGAFSATITVGSHLAISNKASLSTVNRTQPLTVTWTGGVEGNYVLIVGNTPGLYADDASIPSANFACAEDAGKGTFTIPGYILSSMNATAGARGLILLAPHPLSNQITIPGIDLAYFTDGSSDSVSATFQ